MKVAIDISQIVYGTGVSVYTQELISELSKHRELDLVLYAGTLQRKQELAKYKAKIFPISPNLADLIWNKLHVLPIEHLIGKVDVIHTSDWAEPPSRIPKVTTVHDLSPILFPEETNPKIVQVHKRKLEWVKKESRAIIVPSESTKSDLISLGYERDKIHVIYEALPSNFKSAKGQRPIIKGKYILSVGTAKRKNIDKIREAVGEYKLVVVGQGGRVSDNDLRNLYANAECLVYASLYEGFGLPILESFASCCPVVTSNTSSMPEVAGDAAVLVNPESVESISKGVIKAIRNKNELVKKGLARVKMFSWEENAKRTIEVYKKVALAK